MKLEKNLTLQSLKRQNESPFYLTLNFEFKKIESKNNLKVNSIDQKAKQFADFFNGEIVNLE